MTGDPRVRIEDVSHRYGSVAALDGVSLDIADGEFVTLLGPSGCGKTTLLRIVAGFERPGRGRVLLAGEDVTQRPAHKRATNMVFQRPTLFPHLDVFANVAFGLQVAGVSRDEQRARVRESLELVRLDGYERRRSHELSGGQMSARGAGARARQPAARCCSSTSRSRRWISRSGSRWRSSSVACTARPAPRSSTSRTTSARRWRSRTGSP